MSCRHFRCPSRGFIILLVLSDGAWPPKQEPQNFSTKFTPTRQAFWQCQFSLGIATPNRQAPPAPDCNGLYCRIPTLSKDVPLPDPTGSDPGSRQINGLYCRILTLSKDVPLPHPTGSDPGSHQSNGLYCRILTLFMQTRPRMIILFNRAEWGPKAK